MKLRHDSLTLVSTSGAKIRNFGTTFSKNSFRFSHEKTSRCSIHFSSPVSIRGQTLEYLKKEARDLSIQWHWAMFGILAATLIQIWLIASAYNSELRKRLLDPFCMIDTCSAISLLRTVAPFGLEKLLYQITSQLLDQL